MVLPTGGLGPSHDNRQTHPPHPSPDLGWTSGFLLTTISVVCDLKMGD